MINPFKSKKGLGRGLSSLIGDSDIKTSSNKISISSIVPNKNQPRKNFEKEPLDELKNTIIEKGIIQLTKPILTMGWCIECHNKKEIDLTKSGYYEEIHERLKNRPDAMSKILDDKKVTVKELGGWECAKCHY